ncbi:MAG: hypothetical protein P8Y71_26485 [Pseudolabrys sp.]
MLLSLCRSSRRAALITSAIALLLLGTAGRQPAAATEGPFADQAGKATERIRCQASYRPIGSTQHEIDLGLKCDSDSYKFNLTGHFRADEGNHVSGQWTEHTRGVGGIVIGNVRGDRFQLHVESNAFTADMAIVRRGISQSISFDAHGGGQVVRASVSLSRR